MSFKSLLMGCTNEECLHAEDYTFDFRGLSDEERQKEIDEYKCPKCGSTAKRQWTAPRIGTAKNSSQEWSRMKQSFKEHYVKNELDDLRHKHGRMIDESHVGAALEKATGERAEDVD